MSEELLREFREDMQREKLVALWNRFGNLIVGASIAVVVVTVIGVGWKHWRISQSQGHTHVLMQALKDNKPEVLGELVQDTKGEVRALAALRQADLLVKQEKKEEAGKQLAAVAEKSSGTPFAELAVVEAQQLTGSAPSLPEEGAPFSFTRIEMAAWAKVKEGKKDEAAKLFAQIKDATDAPMSMRERAFQAYSRLAPEAAEKGDDKK